MIQLGRYNKLKKIKDVDFGIYLDGEDYGEVLMPAKYVPEGIEVGDEVEGFVYRDTEDRIIVTTEKPYAQVGEFAYLEATSVNRFGAFLDWGLTKELLVPFKEQTKRMEEGKFYPVYLYIDHETDRIAASAKLDQFLDNTPHSYEKGDKVDLFACNITDLGYKVIVDDLYWGIIYQDEIVTPIERGSRFVGYIKNVREDGKLDISLQQLGYRKVDDIQPMILEMLKDHDGFIAVNDKTPPEDINALFGISKKAFKMAIGTLFRKRLIDINENGISLVEGKKKKEVKK